MLSIEAVDLEDENCKVYRQIGQAKSSDGSNFHSMAAILFLRFPRFRAIPIPAVNQPVILLL